MDKLVKSKDLAKILEGWEYDPDEVPVRIVEGDDGREKVQLRIDMGLLQMELTGRPDGQRPGGDESWLEYYRKRQREHDLSDPDSASFELDDEACALLWQEAVQYYHRYLSFWHLDRYDLCARDTKRNLGLFDFVRNHAADDRDKMQFDQWRPYVVMMHSRAVATPLVKGDKFSEALVVIESGIDAVQKFLDDCDNDDETDGCIELANLRQWRDEILLETNGSGESSPESVIDILRRQLQEAVSAEQFEKAARLRDEIQCKSDS